MQYTGTFEIFQLNIFVENSLLNISHNFIVIYLDIIVIIYKVYTESWSEYTTCHLPTASKSWSNYTTDKSQKCFIFFINRPSPGLLPVLGLLGRCTDTTHQPSPALRLLGYQSPHLPLSHHGWVVGNVNCKSYLANFGEAGSCFKLRS